MKNVRLGIVGLGNIGKFHTGYLLENKPYVEVGYGVENIFRFLRVDFVHRLTYLDNPNVRNFGVLFTAQFQF